MVSLQTPATAVFEDLTENISERQPENLPENRVESSSTESNDLIITSVKNRKRKATSVKTEFSGF